MNLAIWSLAGDFVLRKLWNLSKWDLSDEVGHWVWSFEEYVLASASQVTTKMGKAASCSHWDCAAMRGQDPLKSEPTEIFPPLNCSGQVLGHSKLKPQKASMASMFHVLVCFQDLAESLSSYYLLQKQFPFSWVMYCAYQGDSHPDLSSL